MFNDNCTHCFLLRRVENEKMEQKRLNKLIDKVLELYLEPDTDVEYKKIMKKIIEVIK